MFDKGDLMMYLYRAAKRISDSLFTLKIVKVHENNLKINPCQIYIYDNSYVTQYQFFHFKKRISLANDCQRICQRILKIKLIWMRLCVQAVRSSWIVYTAISCETS